MDQMISPEHAPAAYEFAPTPDSTFASSTPFFYRCFGLLIASGIRLEELQPAEPSDPDLTIVCRPVTWPSDDRHPVDFRFAPGEQHLHWDGVGTFRILGDSLIEISPAPDVQPNLIAFPLLGPVISVLLHLRGLLVLHASAVSVDGRVAVFMGDKGAGKSTLAGALLAAGHQLVSDDIVAVRWTDAGKPAVLAAFPQLKLAADAAASIDLANVVVRANVHPDINKLQHRLTAGYAGQEVELGAVYVLERGDRASVRQFEHEHGLRLLLRYSYMARFERPAMGGRLAAHFSQCALLASDPGVRLLTVPTGLHRLSGAVDLIRHDIGSLGSSTSSRDR